MQKVPKVKQPLKSRMLLCLTALLVLSVNWSHSLAATSVPGNIIIYQVYPNPEGTDTDEEWFEIHNPSAETIDLSDIAIGDEETPGGGEGMYYFPDTSQIDPGDYVSIARKASGFLALYGEKPTFELVESDPEVPNMEKATTLAGGTLNLGDTADEVVIVAADGSTLDALVYGSGGYLDFIPHPGCSVGQSMIRDLTMPFSRDCAASFEIDESPRPHGAAGGDPAQTKSLLVSEVYFAPTEGSNLEWIEIYNPGVATKNISNCKLGDEESSGGGEGMYVFPENTEIVADGILVIAAKGQDFFGKYGFNPDYELGETDSSIPNLTKYSSWASGSMNLGNSGDEVLLLGSDDKTIDAICYGNGSYPGVQCFPDTAADASLERDPIDGDSDDCQTDFHLQMSPTPGAKPASGQTGSCGTRFEYEVLGMKGLDNWHVGPVDIVLRGVPVQSLVADIQYRHIPDGQWLSYSSPLRIDQAGVFEFEGRTKDASGNLETAKAFTVRLDLTAPMVEVLQVVTQTDNLRPIFKLKVSDLDSGVDCETVKAILDGTDWQPGLEWSGSELRISSVQDLERGNHRVVFSFKDHAGNQNTWQHDFVITGNSSSVKTVFLPSSGQISTTHRFAIGAFGQPVYYRALGVPQGMRLQFQANPTLADSEAKISLSAEPAIRRGAYLVPIVGISTGNVDVMFLKIMVV